MSTPSSVIAPAVDLVEAHEQVDERRLAGAGRADDRDRLARLGVEVEVLDERRVGLVAERDVLEGDRPVDVRQLARRRVSGTSSASSSSSKTRSAEATADWRTFAMLAVWMIGIVNWREYWMNAWTSPSDIVPGRDLHAADDADRDVVEVAMKFIAGWIDARDELGLEARLVELLVLLVERLDRLALAAEHLDDGVPGVHLLDVAVQRPGPLPLGGELLLRAARDEHRDDDRERAR